MTPAPFSAPEQTRSSSAYEAIRTMLLNGALQSGTALLERKLADQLGLSRTPVREALGRLEAEGYLFRESRHFFVTTISVDEVMEILATRRLLEGEAVRLAVGQISRAKLEAVRAVFVSMGETGAVSSEFHWSSDDLLHLSIAEASGNRLLARMIADLRRRTRMFGMKQIPERFEPGRLEHLAIIDAMLSGDRDRAHEAVIHHLNQARDSILKKLSQGVSLYAKN